MRQRKWRVAVGSLVCLALFSLPKVAEGGQAEGEEAQTQDESESTRSEEASGSEEEADEEMSKYERQREIQGRRKARRIAMANGDNENGWLREYWSWDLKMEFGVAKQAARWGVKGDTRIGAVYVDEPNGYAFGAVGELSSMNEPAAGLEVEFLSMKFGTYAQLGGLLDINGQPMATAGVGWQLFAFEIQYEPTPDFNRDSSWIGLAKLHLPVSWVVRALSK